MAHEPEDAPRGAERSDGSLDDPGADGETRPGYPRAQMVLALAGFVGGTACDQIHVRFGVLSYPHPFLLGQAIWVPFLFAGAALALGNGYALVARLVGGGARDGGDRRPPRRATVIVPVAVFVAAYFATALAGDTPVALSVGLAVAWAVHVAVLRDRSVALYSLVCAVCGPLFEAALSSTGAFAYARPAWLVPMWLPALYLHTGPLAAHVWRAFLASAPPAPAGLTFVYRHGR